MYLQRTIQQAKPTKDVWSLACVYSEAAVWVVQGRTGLSRYRLQRTTATNAVEKLRETSHAGCFHDGTKVLQEVLETHVKIRRRRRNNDHITDKVLDLVEDMLGDESSRPEACRVYEKSRTYLKTASRLLQHDRTMDDDYVYPEIFVTPEPHNFDRKDPSGFDQKKPTDFDRPKPPERPPNPYTNGLGVSFGTSMHPNPTSATRVSSPSFPASPRPRYPIGYEVDTDRQSPVDDGNAISLVNNRVEASSPVPVKKAEQGMNTYDPSEPAIIKQTSESHGKVPPYKTPSTPPAVHEQGETPNSVHLPVKEPKSSRVEKKPVNTRTKFPEASIEQVESWIRRIQLNRCTPPLPGNDWLRCLNGRDQVSVTTFEVEIILTSHRSSYSMTLVV
jgi:hypothetical protein